MSKCHIVGNHVSRLIIVFIGESQSKEVDGRDSSIFFSDLDTTELYGVYVFAVSLSGKNSSRSLMIVGRPYKER